MQAIRYLLLLTFCAFSTSTTSACLAKDATAPVTTKEAKSDSAKSAESDTHRFAKEIDAFMDWDAKNAVPRDCILFVGSSSIRLWQTADAFPGLPVVNRGFGGSTIADVNFYSERIVAKYKPRMIVFYAGDNDIAGGKSPDAVFDDFKQFADFVHGRLKSSRLIYLSIKPSPLRWKFWPKAKEVNGRVKQLADESEQLEYVDLATPLLADDGEPNPNYYRPDRLHLNADGYKVWNKVLAPVLRDQK
jgi:lysophospholipase L1-like esterase